MTRAPALRPRRDDCRSIAERNEEVNRRRREAQERQAAAGGKLTVCHPPFAFPRRRLMPRAARPPARLMRCRLPRHAQIHDPAAFARFLAEAERFGAEAAALEAREEAERARREGGAYKPRAQREAEARAARQRHAGGRDADEARGVRDWCDVRKDYYRALGVDRLAATHEIKKAYKRLAMQVRRPCATPWLTLI